MLFFILLWNNLLLNTFANSLLNNDNEVGNKLPTIW